MAITLQELLNRLRENRRYAALRDIFTAMNEADTAALFDELPEPELPVMFRLLPKELRRRRSSRWSRRRRSC